MVEADIAEADIVEADMIGTLTALQGEVLRILAALQPAWTLTGGAALCGFHLRHRTTRDLDLFWHGRNTLEREPVECERLLREAGLRVDVLQRTPSFVRLFASNDAESVVVDLVAEPVAALEPPEVKKAGGLTIHVDSEHEIFANKLGALLHRAELRDLVDLRALLDRGADLARGLTDAARKDGGFSPLMVGHLLRTFPVQRQASSAGMSAGEAEALVAFRDQLAERIAALARP